MKRLKKTKHVIYLLIALSMLVIALPRISFAGGMDWVNIFGIVWVLFSLLIVGAHLHFILGVDEEKKRALEAVRRAKLRQWEMKLLDKQERSESV
ncbi:hypothetical protein NKT34_16685 [Paenibacillus polysaccharolyticus]|uniref:Uncharacterized protein n=2 Tax=Paenibacillus TaxID=44249 RepID=A0A1G5I9T5_9BACL|nr:MULTISPECIES: hypothetical protein [Paenibacillus]MDP9698826.1 hypothetical protein [Paenibacillus intestini]MBY0201741.1 hypothetical protein [Paenibacillus cucumis (ex Kampfer et al. 2016)]MCM3131585.1 hypothetical protein [Paenibacillus polysaccharolyticus]MCP1134939.1 hypothetical protein [Paenibacillus polysaccharolyticus]MDT0121947.1 hypothetical protein [Paenibacillus sp. RRE4]